MNAIYARQSVDKKDSVSIETQIESCLRCLDSAYQIYQDRGFSGKNINRPAFTQLLEDIKAGKITKLWVYRLDRFSRSILDFGQLWALLEQHHVEFESISEKFDTSTPSGRAMLNIIMTFAQLERETIAERVRDNYYHRFALGAWPGGPAPLGFTIGRLANAAGQQVSTLCPNEKAALIERIYRAYLEPNASLGSVARRLTEEKIQGLRRIGWDSVAIARILKNPVYVRANQEVCLYYLGQGIPVEQPAEAFCGDLGCHLVGKRDRAGGGKTTPRLSLANHCGIIPAQLWLACQKKQEENRQLDRSHVGKYSWLSGLLKCAGCGYAVKINRCDGGFSLHCSGRSNLGICRQKIKLDLRELERELGREIEKLLARCPDEAPELTANAEISCRLLALDACIERLLAAYARSEKITADYLNREISRLESERQKLLLESKKTPRCQGLRRIEFESLSRAEKKMVASQLIERVLLSEETAEIIWRI